MLLAPVPPGFPCGGDVGGLFPAATVPGPSNPCPPPEPPALPASNPLPVGPTPSGPPVPPPAAVIGVPK